MCHLRKSTASSQQLCGGNWFFHVLDRMSISPESSAKSRTISVGAGKLACVRSPLTGATNWHTGPPSQRFTGLLIFIYISEHFFLTKMKASFRLWAHLRYKIYKKGRLNIIKRSKVPFSGLRVLLTDLWDLDSRFHSTKIRAKIVPKMVGENAITRLHEGYGLLRESTRDWGKLCCCILLFSLQSLTAFKP